MTDSDTARFELLKLELTFIQNGIRGFDSILFQVKGWSVTVTVALAGIAISQTNVMLLAAGMMAAIAFWLMDAHTKALQRVFIARDQEIERALAGQDPLAVLASGQLTVPGLASTFRDLAATSYWGRLGHELRRIGREARLPVTFGLYLIIVVLLGLLMVVLAIS